MIEINLIIHSNITLLKLMRFRLVNSAYILKTTFKNNIRLKRCFLLTQVIKSRNFIILGL